MRDNLEQIVFQPFLQEALVSGSGTDRDVVHPAVPLPTTASPTFRGALKDGFGEAVVACDMPEPCNFQLPSTDS